jgi:hypothetical protein
MNALHQFQMVTNRMDKVQGGFVFLVEGKTND